MCVYKKNEAKFNTSLAETSLFFDDRKKDMILTVYSPERVYSVEDDIRCYSYRYNLDNEKFKKIDIEKLFDSRTDGEHNTFMNYRNFTVFKLKIKENPNAYWCKVFTRGSASVLISEKRIAYLHGSGNEFVMYLKVTIKDKYPEDHLQKLRKFCSNISVSCRVFELLDFDESNYTSFFLTHITTKRSQKLVMAEYVDIKRQFRKIDYFNIVDMRVADWCLPTKNQNLSWPLTPMEEIAMSSQLCITQNDIIALRKCQGNFINGSSWGPFTEDCLEDVHLPEKTKYLYKVLHTEKTSNTIESLSVLSDYFHDFSVMDISFLSKILYDISLSDTLNDTTHQFYKIFDGLFNVSNGNLKAAQTVLNSTDLLLNALDLYLNKYTPSKLGTEGLTVYIRKHLMIHVTKPFLNNISGVALYCDSGSCDSFWNYTIANLYATTNKTEVDETNLEVAAYVPKALLNRLVSNCTDKEKADLTIITTIFTNDVLFNEESENGNKSVDSKVISVLIPGYGTYLEHPITLLLKRQKNTTDNCAYWEYGKYIDGKKGKWSETGVNYKQEFANGIVHCAFSHLTHFALLIWSDRSDKNSNESTSIAVTYDYELSVITIVCSVISTIGILGIFLTAILYSTWREKQGTKFLLQLSLTILLEMIFIQFSGIAGSLSEYEYSETCTVVGILLHYIVLSKFAWMLVTAFLQYLRFVKVLGATPTNLLLKSVIVGWLCPILPVVLTVTIFPSCYSTGYNFCYPRGLALYVGLIAPSIIIIAANITVFILVMQAIGSSKALKYDKSGKLMKKQVYLAILLFFLLGIHWLFGILAELLPNTWLVVIFVFLFCITSGLQGFVLFVFYVVLDKDTRLLWVTSIKSYIYTI